MSMMMVGKHLQCRIVRLNFTKITYRFAMSADRSSIVMQGIPAGSKAYFDYYLINSDGSNRRRLTTDMIIAYEAMMLPDGRILISAQFDGSKHLNLYIMNRSPAII